MAGETEAQLEAMPMDQLEALVSAEGPAPDIQATGETVAKGETTGQAEPTEIQTPNEDAPPKWFQTYAENMKRELGSFRSLQSLTDKLPQMVQQQIAAQMQRVQQAQANVNLSPEDRQAQAQLQSQQDALAKYVREQSRAEFGEAAGKYLPVLEKLMENQERDVLEDASFSIAKDFIPDKDSQKEAWNKVFEKSYNDIQAGKPGAIENQTRLEKDPAFLALEMVRVARNQVQNQAQQVTQQRANAGRQAAQSPKGGNAPSAGKRSIAEMSDTEMDKMSIAELEAAIPEQ